MELAEAISLASQGAPKTEPRRALGRASHQQWRMGSRLGWALSPRLQRHSSNWQEVSEDEKKEVKDFQSQ